LPLSPTAGYGSIVATWPGAAIARSSDRTGTAALDSLREWSWIWSRRRQAARPSLEEWPPIWSRNGAKHRPRFGLDIFRLHGADLRGLRREPASEVLRDRPPHLVLDRIGHFFGGSDRSGSSAGAHQATEPGSYDPARRMRGTDPRADQGDGIAPVHEFVRTRRLSRELSIGVRGKPAIAALSRVQSPPVPCPMNRAHGTRPTRAP